MSYSLAYPLKKQTGRIHWSGSITGTIAVGDTVTGGSSGATALVKKIDTTKKEIHVNNITAIFAALETITATSGGTASIESAANIGFNLGYISNAAFHGGAAQKGLVKTKKIGTRILEEILVPYRHSKDLYDDFIVIPTVTSSVATYSGTKAMIAGDVMTITLNMSEAVAVTGIPTIGMTVTGSHVARKLYYNAAASTGTALKFQYTVPTPATADVSTAGQVVVASGSVTFPAGSYLSDVNAADPEKAKITVAPTYSAVTTNVTDATIS